MARCSGCANVPTSRCAVSRGNFVSESNVITNLILGRTVRSPTLTVNTTPPDEGLFLLSPQASHVHPSENTWMGWERKRGKLWNRTICCVDGDRFPVKVGDLTVLPKIRFVITLRLGHKVARDTAQRLVGTLAHPLHRAIIDPINQHVTIGYGILQPRSESAYSRRAARALHRFMPGATGSYLYKGDL